MHAIHPGTHDMTDQTHGELLESSPLHVPTAPRPLATPPASPAVKDEPIGRYDANVQLILRRLADAERTKKPRWWWQSH